MSKIEICTDLAVYEQLDTYHEIGISVFAIFHWILHSPRNSSVCYIT